MIFLPYITKPSHPAQTSSQLPDATRLDVAWIYNLSMLPQPAPHFLAQFSLDNTSFPPSQADQGSTDQILQAFQLDTVLNDGAAHEGRYHTLFANLDSEAAFVWAAGQW